MTSQRLGIEILTSEGSITKLVAPPHITTRAVAIGSQAEVAVDGEGVAPEHLFAIIREGRLLVASATTAVPVMLVDRRSSAELAETALLPARWVALDLPCRVRLGETIVRFFWCTRAPKAITPPPSLMLDAAAPPTPPTPAVDSERTTQKRPNSFWSEPAIDIARVQARRRPLPPPTPPPRRSNSVRTIPAVVVARESGQSRSGSGKSSAVNGSARRNGSDPTLASLSSDAVTLRTPLPGPLPTAPTHPSSPSLSSSAVTNPLRTPLPMPRANADDTTHVRDRDRDRDREHSRPELPPPASHATTIAPLPAPTPHYMPPAHAKAIPRRPVQTPSHGSVPPPSGNPTGETFLFQMASRAVDAWNRFVEDIDKSKTENKTPPRAPR